MPDVTEALSLIWAYGVLLRYRYISIIILGLTRGLRALPQLKPVEPNFHTAGLTGSCFVSSYSIDKEQLLFENLFYSYRKSVANFILKTNFIELFMVFAVYFSYHSLPNRLTIQFHSFYERTFL